MSSFKKNKENLFGKDFFRSKEEKKLDFKECISDALKRFNNDVLKVNIVFNAKFCFEKYCNFGYKMHKLHYDECKEVYELLADFLLIVSPYDSSWSRYDDDFRYDNPWF